MTVEPERDRGCRVNRLYSGERICCDDYYLIERHDGKGFYKDDWGRMVPCGMFPDYSSKDATPKTWKQLYHKTEYNEDKRPPMEYLKRLVNTSQFRPITNREMLALQSMFQEAINEIEQWGSNSFSDGNFQAQQAYDQAVKHLRGIQ